MTNLYHAKCRNDIQWISSGAMDYSFYLTARDFTEATVKAQSALENLIQRVSDQVPTLNLEGFRVQELIEIGHLAEDGEETVADVPSAFRKHETTAEWIENLVSRIKREHPSPS